jgi:spermidine synthase
MRRLGLVFGVTVEAASTVWASFMAGLAIGSLVGGMIGDRARRPLLWFGAVEALVGVTALATPMALDLVQQAYTDLSPRMSSSQALLTVVRVAMTAGVLLVPTMLMGASLPLVVRSALGRGGPIGPSVGLLYGTNTAGAIAGTLAAGLALIPALGIRWTFMLAAAANLLVGTAAMVFSLAATAPTRSAGESATAAAAQPNAPLRVRRLVLIVFFLSGLATFALEVIWFRVIVLLARPTVYAFSMMLAAVLFGIALGSLVIARWMRQPQPWLARLVVFELLLGVVALLSLAILNYTPTLYSWVEPALIRVLPGYLAYAIVVAVLPVLPASVLMGMAFPVGLEIWAGRGSAADGRTASRVGLFYSLNVGGAILGSLLAGFVLLPALGSRGSLIAIAAVIFGSGLALGAVAAPLSRARVTAGLGLAAGFAIVALFVSDPFDAFLRARFRDHQVIWREESVQATVSVHRQPDGQLNLHLEGNHQANDSGSMVNSHGRIGHLPMAIHPNARQALVIGLGGGVTAGAVAFHEGVAVDIVEISDAVVRGARYFSRVNYGVLARPNAHVHVGDGRNFLQLTSRRYDVITADIILPIYAGSGNLYSTEYFQLVRQRLNPGGLFVQWVAGTDHEYRAIMRTFLSMFPHATLWGNGSLMVGTTEPLRLRRADFDWKLQVPGRLRALERLGVRSFDDLLGMYTAGPEEMRRFVGDGPLLTDDRPLVEYFLSMPRDRDPDLSRLRGDVRRHVVDD